MAEFEPPRKRLRRDTKRCTECRRRRVKCQLTSENVDACAECIKTGAVCSTGLGTDKERASGEHPCSNCLDQNEKLNRMEDMLQRILSAREFKVPHKQTSPETLLFGDVDLGTDVFPISMPDPSLNDRIKEGFCPSSESIAQKFKDDGAKQVLLDLLPTQSDAIAIGSHTSAWMIELDNPPGAVWRSSQPISFGGLRESNQSSLLSLAKSLLFFAIGLQQLSPEFDATKLDLADDEQTVRTYIQVVTSMVLSDDDLACSMEGLECLLLLGMIHVNEYSLKKAWLVFRRAVDIARLLDFHEIHSSTTPGSDTKTLAFQQHLWMSAVMSECYCSNLLGLETSVGMHPFGPENGWSENLGDPDVTFLRRTWAISSQLTQNRLFKVDKGLEATKGINDALDQLDKSMPSLWWRAPKLRRERSISSALDHERYLCQLYFFQLRMLVNLPFAMGGADEDRREAQEFKETCLEAARNILHRFLGILQAGNSQLHCRVFDLGAFLAAATIILASVPESSKHDAARRGQRQRSDRTLVDQVIDSLTALGAVPYRERVAAQSAEVLNALLEVTQSEDFSSHGATANKLYDVGRTRKYLPSGFGGARDLLLSVFGQSAEHDGAVMRAIDHILLPVDRDALDFSASVGEATFMDHFLEENALNWNI